MMIQKAKKSGFTLLEVIVSLVILTIALTAIISVGSNRAETLLEIRERNWALIVANNVLEKYYTESVQAGVIDGKQENGDFDWNWQLSVIQTNNEHIYRMDVKVSKDNDFEYSSAQLVGFKWH
ncbi:MAG: type II secretion system minor pseudopilin GspI [Alcanivoracaceae bacterium]|nr:type II secretion system minor pseudopilin GspI [Alcanivoracaceae bacterium]